MSFVMISAGPTSSSRVRTLPIRTLLGAGVLLALGLLTVGGALGFWASQQVAAVPASNPTLPSARPFAIEQLGALSGRLFRLESQAGQLSQRIGLLQSGAVHPAQAASEARRTQGPSGGPMLPPRPEPEGLVALQLRLAELEQQIERVASAATQQSLARMRLPTRLPLDNGDLVSGFGNRDDPLDGRRAFHAGLDFAAAQGTAIHAAAGGTVAFAGVKSEFGRVVEIDHGNGLSTRYAHASALWVKTGDFVAPGDAIAAVGSSGRSTGAHLHFEVLQHGDAVNPRHYLAGL
jgi:murein DD-endopeptidase MepM/ murein hydrolase activator NlpD